MFIFVKSNYKCKKPIEAMRPKEIKPRQQPQPSGWQYMKLQEITRYLQGARSRRRSEVYGHLGEVWGVEVREARMYNFGGVGSFQWMPRLRCYRVQVGAGHINRNGASYNYAPCIEIYDY